MDLAALGARFKTWLRRFDQRPQRERVLMAAAAAAFVFMCVDALWFGAAFKSWQVARQQQQVARATLSRLEVEAGRRHADHGTLLRQQQAELALWRQRVREGEDSLRSFEASLVGPDQMLGLLEQMLARHGQVRLRSMQSLGRSDLLPADAAPQPAAVTASGAAGRPQATAAPAGAGLYRHGVELTLEGGFADLLSYLQALEAMPERLLWGQVSFKVEQYPRATLTLRVHTISRDRHWLEI